MADHRKHWVDGAVTPGQRRTADKRMDRHVARSPKCASADVCVHTGFIVDSAYCVGCGAKIG